MIWKSLLLSSLLFLTGQYVPSGPVFPHVASCTPPTMTYRWQVANPAIGCVAGACVNGGSINSLPSSVGSNTGTQANVGQFPIYTTNVINGQPAALFNGATNNRDLLLATALPTTGSMTLYAVVSPVSACTTSPCAIFGGSPNATGFEWRLVNFPPLKQQSLLQGSAALGGSNTTISTSGFSVLATTYNFSSGAWQFFICAAGTCTSDGSGTTTATFSPFSSQQLGSASSAPGGDNFNGYIAEWGYLNSISIAGIATYANCEYGI